MTNLTILSSLLVNSDSTEVNEPSSKRCRNVITPANHIREQRLTSSLFGDIGLLHSSETVSVNTSTDVSDNDVVLKRLVKAMTARDTIDLIYNKLFSV
jgi:hypothetical protein